MQCPLHDGELTSHTTQGENGLTVSYSTCPVCRGYWMDSFAANFIKPTGIDATTTITAVSTCYCPVCTALLARTTGDNIPDGVFVFDCPSHHGYFFPTGQLAAFKKAQTAKISYHKLWHIPLLNVGSILLAGLVLLILTGGFAATFTGLQKKQVTQSQAQQILTGHAVYTASDHSAILITAMTSVEATVTIHIPALNNLTVLMITDDYRTHRLTIPTLQPGFYTYSFTITVSGKETQSEPFTFTILDQ